MRPDDPDLPLVQRIQSGDEEAFGELMRRYKRPLLNFVYRVLGEAGEAEDVAQESFVRAYRHLRGFRPGSARFSTWLFRIARNAALDHVRRRARRPEVRLEEAGVAPSTEATAATEVQAREAGEQIARAVARLPEDQRTALVLAEYQGLSYAEIAEVMACSTKAVESRLYRAKQTLRAALAHLLG